MNPLRDACAEVMRDREVTHRYPEGLCGADVLTEIRARRPNAFPLCTVLDVIDEMRALYGQH